MNIKQISLILLVLAAVAAFFAFDLGQYLQLSYLSEQRADLQAFLSAVTADGYSDLCHCIYIVATALSLPGAAVLTLAGGALFGFWCGAVSGVLRQHDWRNLGLFSLTHTVARLGAGQVWSSS